MVLEISEHVFKQKVLSRKARFVLVDFWAEWCRPCKIITPILGEVSEEVGKKVKIAKLNIGKYPQLAEEVGVKNLPTLILFKHGKEISRKIGVHSKEILLEWVQNVLNENK